jgi:hypothetical protein
MSPWDNAHNKDLELLVGNAKGLWPHERGTKNLLIDDISRVITNAGSSVVEAHSLIAMVADGFVLFDNK